MDADINDVVESSLQTIANSIARRATWNEAPQQNDNQPTEVQPTEVQPTENFVRYCDRNKPLDHRQKDFCAVNKNVYIKRMVKGEPRSYDNVHACTYCGMLFTDIQTHLVRIHRSEMAVKDLITCRKELHEAKEEGNRPKIKLLSRAYTSKQDILRLLGDHYHNQTVMRNKSGELLVRRRCPLTQFNSTSYLACPACKEWFRLQRHVYRHQATCPAECQQSGKELVLAAQLICEHITVDKKDIIASDQLKKEVFSSMIADELSQLAQNDQLIVGLGELWLSKCIHNKRKRKNIASFRMRLAARLLKQVCELANIELTCMNDLICGKYFDYFIQAGIALCKVSDEDDDSMRHPSTAIKIGYDLARLASAKLGRAVRNDDKEQKAAAKGFIALVRDEWRTKVNKRAEEVLLYRKFNKRLPLPLPEDVKKLALYLIDLLKTYDYSETPWREVAITLEAYLLSYNKRRPAEIEDLT